MEETPVDLVMHSSNPFSKDICGIQIKDVCLEFPKFDGEDPNGRLYKANQFFSYHPTPSP